jgi:hypothetical protein
MSTMSQFFGGGGAVTGDLRSVNKTVENTSGWYENGTQADKTADATLYSYLNGKGLAADWVDVATPTPPAFARPAGMATQVDPTTIAKNVGNSPFIFNGTNYFYADNTSAGRVYYATAPSGPWIALPDAFPTGTPQNLLWIASINTLVIFKTSAAVGGSSFGAITRYDLTGGIANSTEALVTYCTNNQSLAQFAWNTSLSKLVYVDTYSATPVVSAISLDGTGKVNFTNTFAGSPMAINSVNGTTVIMHNSSFSATIIRVAASGSTDFTATNVSTINLSTNGTFGDIVTDGTNIVCARLAFSSPNNYVVYHFFNGTTWSTYTGTAISFFTNSSTEVSAISYGGRWYFRPGTQTTSYQDFTNNLCWSVTTLGGTPTNLTSAFSSTSTREVVPIAATNNRLFWTYKWNGGTSTTNAVVYSTSDNLTTNQYEYIATTRTSANMYGQNCGFNAAGKFFTAYNSRVNVSGTGASGVAVISVLSTSDFTTWAVERQIFSVSRNWAQLLSPVIDINKITFSGNNAYFFVQYIDNTSTYWNIFIGTTNNFSTVTFNAFESYTTTVPGGRSYSVTDGTFAYLVRAASTFSTNTSVTYLVDRFTLSNGTYTAGWATAQASVTFAASTQDWTPNFSQQGTVTSGFRPSLTISGSTMYMGLLSNIAVSGFINYSYNFVKVTTAGVTTPLPGNASTQSPTNTYAQIDQDATYAYLPVTGIAEIRKSSENIIFVSPILADNTFRIPDFSNNSYRNNSGAGQTLSSVLSIGDLFTRAQPATVAGVVLTNNVPTAYLNSQLISVSGSVKVFCSFDPVNQTTNFVYRLTQNTTKYGIPAMTTNATGVTQTTAYIKG